MEQSLDGKCCAEALRRMRIARHLQQEELERRCSMKHQQISRMESGSVVPKISTIRKLVWAMGADFMEFAQIYNELLKKEVVRGEEPILQAALKDSITYNVGK